MPRYTVQREMQAVATVHASSDSVAKSTVIEEVSEQLTAAGADSIETLDIQPTDIYEFPSGPFDPYRLSVQLILAVPVEAADEQTAIEAGAETIETLLAATDLDDIEYVGSAQLDAPAN